MFVLRVWGFGVQEVRVKVFRLALYCCQGSESISRTIASTCFFVNVLPSLANKSPADLQKALASTRAFLIRIGLRRSYRGDRFGRYLSVDR